MSDVTDVAEVAKAPEPPVPVQAPHIPGPEMVAAPVPSNGDAVEGGDQAEAPAAQKVEKKKRERAQPVPVESSEGGEEGRPKRERKQTEVFKAVEPAKKEKEMIVPGSGILLADYGYFCRGLEKLRGDDEVVTGLHSLIYGAKGKKLETKKNLRQFSGFAADVNTEEKTAKMIENKKKWTVSVLKSCMDLFGMEKSGTREELIARLVSFLAKPEQLRSESSFGGGGKKSGSKRKSKGGKEPKAKKAKRPPSGYILFTTANREKVKAENPDADFKGMSQLLGDKWKNLSDAEKAVWNAQSAELKAAAGAAAGGDEGEEQEEEEEEGEETEDEAEEEDVGGETGKNDDEELFDEDDDGYDAGSKGLSAVKEGNNAAASASSSSSSAAAKEDSDI